MVMIPIGAIPSAMSSAQPMDVARNCFVTSSPNKVNRGAKSVKALFSKFDEVDMVKIAIGDDFEALVAYRRESNEIRKWRQSVINHSNLICSYSLSVIDCYEDCGKGRKELKSSRLELKKRKACGLLHDVFTTPLAFDQ